MVQVLEEGDVFFCYRPKVDVDQVRGLDDIQRFYLILKPGGKPAFRRMVIGRKRLPGIEEHERSWGFIDLVTERPEELEGELDPVAYETRTRGSRVVPPVRPAGEGVYAVTEHEGSTYVAYALELPEQPGPVQDELNISPQASLVATVRNPDVPAPPQAGLPQHQQPDYPDALRERFGGRRFAELDPPDFLDYPGTELVLIGASPDVSRELGLHLHPRRKTEQSAGTFTVLGMERDLHPAEPLLTGEWR